MQFLQKPSPNFSQRNTEKISHIILHYTEMEFDEAINRLTCQSSEVSCHYLIHKNGDIYNLVRDEMKAWHAGKSYWRGIIDLNQCSIGIELDNLGNQPFTEKQISSCINLCKHLVNKYQINPINILGHSDIACDRKIDPGVFFPWYLLSSFNLGINFHEIDGREIITKTKLADLKHSEVKNIQKHLALIGYKVNITGNLDDETKYAIRAFKLHFLQCDLNQEPQDINSLFWHKQASDLLLEISQNLVSK